MSPESIVDLDEIGAYFDSIVETASKKVIAQLLAAIDSLEHLPRRYQVRHRRKSPDKDVHALVSFPYLAYYRVNDSARVVTVFRILHGARRQPKRYR